MKAIVVRYSGGYIEKLGAAEVEDYRPLCRLCAQGRATGLLHGGARGLSRAGLTPGHHRLGRPALPEPPFHRLFAAPGSRVLGLLRQGFRLAKGAQRRARTPRRGQRRLCRPALSHAKGGNRQAALRLVTAGVAGGVSGHRDSSWCPAQSTTRRTGGPSSALAALTSPRCSAKGMNIVR